MGRWITESGNLERNRPLCAFDRGTYSDKLTKDGKSHRLFATLSKGVHLNTRLPATWHRWTDIPATSLVHTSSTSLVRTKEDPLGARENH